VHRKYIPFDMIPTRCNITHFIYFWKTAPTCFGRHPRPSSGAHTTVFTVSGTC